MNNSPSETAPFACDSLLWIGDTHHASMRGVWDVCRAHCDTIAIRPSLAAAIESPPRRLPTHVLVAQTNRHESATLTIDGPMPVGPILVGPILGGPMPGGPILGGPMPGGLKCGGPMPANLQSTFPGARRMVIRGPLVAPTVKLPPGPSIASAGAAADVSWIDSITCDEAIGYLPFWFDNSLRTSAFGTLRAIPPLVVVASGYPQAEAYLDSLAMLCSGIGGREPLLRWQRELTARSATGYETILWDDSAAGPTTLDGWRSRCRLAPSARHVWITGLATSQQKRVAIEGGIEAVVEKPARLECLLASAFSPTKRGSCHSNWQAADSLSLHGART